VIAFDEHVAGRFEDVFGPGCDMCIHPSYKVTGSSEAIAFNKDGTGFAKVNLLFTSGSENRPRDTHENEKVLLPSVVSFGFPQGSHKISSVAWCVLKDSSRSCSNCGSVMSGGRSEATSKDSLESQTVYPSVVSFDGAGRGKDHVTQQHGQGHASEDMEVPGMSLE